jgi:hypothetical protein
MQNLGCFHGEINKTLDGIIQKRLPNPAKPEHRRLMVFFDHCDQDFGVKKLQVNNRSR